MKYGKRILCENRGPFWMREILRPGEATLYIDDSLAKSYTPEAIVALNWASSAPINPQ